MSTICLKLYSSSMSLLLTSIDAHDYASRRISTWAVSLSTRARSICVTSSMRLRASSRPNEPASLARAGVPGYLLSSSRTASFWLTGLSSASRICIPVAEPPFFCIEY